MARKPGQSHLNQRVSRVASRLDDHKLLLGMIVMAVGAFLAYVAFVSTTGPPFQSRYEIKVEVPPDAPPLREGQAVRVAGNLAGLISRVEPDRDSGGTLATANITKTQFRPIGEDATARVTVHSIVYETYLELDPGDTEEPMENGETIPQRRVSSGVDLLEVVQLFDEEARESLRATVVNVGHGLAGRGNAANEANADLEPTAQNLDRQLRAATADEGALGTAVAGAAATTRGLEGDRPDDVGGLIGSGSEVFGAIAQRSTELGAALRELRPFEDELLATAPLAEPLLGDLALTAGELRPTVASINRSLPDVNRLLGLGGVLERETARITDVADPVLRTSRPLVRDVYPTVASLNPLLPDVERVAETVNPYAEDISLAGQGLAEATSTRFPFGQGPGVNAPAGRIIPVLTCHANRNPFPAPGGALEDAESC